VTGFSSSNSVSPVSIIPPMLHTNHLRVGLIRRTNGRSLGTSQKQCALGYRGALDRAKTSGHCSEERQVPWASLVPQNEHVQVANDLISIRPTWMAEFECIMNNHLNSHTHFHCSCSNIYSASPHTWNMALLLNAIHDAFETGCEINILRTSAHSANVRAQSSYSHVCLGLNW
jgi:hypothetical protein